MFVELTFDDMVIVFEALLKRSGLRNAETRERLITLLSAMNYAKETEQKGVAAWLK